MYTFDIFERSNPESKMSNLKHLEINFQLLCTKVGEIIGDDSPQRIQASLVYLLEEVSYARHQWEECLKNRDWHLASKILHREKLFINAFDLFHQPEMVVQIQKNPDDFKMTELKSFYAEMIQLFKKFETLISQNNSPLPV